jgi:hypothetical protein
VLQVKRAGQRQADGLDKRLGTSCHCPLTAVALQGSLHTLSKGLSSCVASKRGRGWTGQMQSEEELYDWACKPKSSEALFGRRNREPPIPAAAGTQHGARSLASRAQTHRAFATAAPGPRRTSSLPACGMQ